MRWKAVRHWRQDFETVVEGEFLRIDEAQVFMLQMNRNWLRTGVRTLPERSNE